MLCPNCKTECSQRVVEGMLWFRCYTCPFLSSPSQKKIDRLYAVINIQADGHEGIVAGIVNGVYMALINSNVGHLWEYLDRYEVDTTNLKVMEFTLSNKNVKRD